MNEAILGALIVAQLAEMRLAMRALCKRVETLENRPPPPGGGTGRIIRTGLAVVAGLSIYLAAR